ncbi:hypothetical protein Y032_0028g1828 [Ancylostoma ceylanicum]|uniref:Uncharacterized protein n=1 Tax=Ancylostoma ceylanicum TaxID=53326 RepID=A0A016UTU4_9BILA|nr:hypothetical protein Y032_0028g1828 [Ancylostoma ceylanicum]
MVFVPLRLVISTNFRVDSGFAIRCTNEFSGAHQRTDVSGSEIKRGISLVFFCIYSYFIFFAAFCLFSFLQRQRSEPNPCRAC